MIGYLEWFVIAWPLLAALLNALAGHRVGRQAQTWIAVGGAVGAALALLPLCLSQVLAPGLVGQSRSLPWINVWDGMHFVAAPLRLYIDALSIWTALAVVAVSVWALVWAVAGEQVFEEQPRWLSLTLIDGLLASVLLVVLADNLWTVFLGWSTAGWQLYALLGRSRVSMGWLLWLIVGDIGLMLAIGVLSQSFVRLDVGMLSVPPARGRLAGLLPAEFTWPAARPMLVWAVLSRLGLLFPAVHSRPGKNHRAVVLLGLLIALPGSLVWLRRLSIQLFPLAGWQVLVALLPAGLVWLLAQGQTQIIATGQFLTGLEARAAQTTVDRVSRWLLRQD